MLFKRFPGGCAGQYGKTCCFSNGYLATNYILASRYNVPMAVVADSLGRERGIPVGAARRLGDHLVHDAKLLQAAGVERGALLDEAHALPKPDGLHLGVDVNRQSSRNVPKDTLDQAPACALATRARAWMFAYSGKAMAVRIPMMATTIISSMSVKPR